MKKKGGGKGERVCGRGLYLKKSIFLWGLRREFEGCGDIVQVRRWE